MSAEPSQLEVQYAPTSAIHPNPWNPNRMDRRTLDAERESIRQYGFVDPITCRPHPDNLGEYEVIDGEHRLGVAIEEGIEVLPIVVLPLDDAQAKKLTIILNETRGQADPVSLAILLSQLHAELGELELNRGLPYSSREMEEFLQIGAVDWDNFDAQHAETLDDYVAKRSGSSPRFLHFSKDQAKQFDTWVAMIQREKEIESPEEAVLLAVREIAGAL